MAISFKVSKEDRAQISAILDRMEDVCAKAGAQPFDRMSSEMDLCACHANGTPLDFERLAKADDFNIAHDVFGIARHINRDTGRLTGHFLPRFARKQTARAA